MKKWDGMKNAPNFGNFGNFYHSKQLAISLYTMYLRGRNGGEEKSSVCVTLLTEPSQTTRKHNFDSTQLTLSRLKIAFYIRTYIYNIIQDFAIFFLFKI